jgi:hypothetical protein
MANYDQNAKLDALVRTIRDEYTRATTTYPFDRCWTRIALHLVARGVIADFYTPDFDVSEVLENLERRCETTLSVVSRGR